MTNADRQKVIKNARQVLTRSSTESERISETLVKSREVRENATKVLKRAGYHLS